MMQKTLIIVKPDAVQRGLVGEITTRFEKKGLKLVGSKMEKLEKKTLKTHYAHLVEKPFYPSIEEFMTSGPVILQIWEGYEAVETVRQLCGVTNSRAALPGTIRGDLSMSYGANIIHASDSESAAKAEIERFFSTDEIFEYDKIIEQVSYSEEERKK